MTATTTETENEDRGLVCPGCGCRHFCVIYTRTDCAGVVVRRRECRHCGRRVTTKETIFSA